MEYVVMSGKLVACWLVGENRRVGFLIGAIASAALTFLVYESALYGVAVYEVLACLIQLRAYVKHRGTYEGHQEQRSARVADDSPSTEL